MLPEDTELSAKGRIIRAAEQLFADKGIEATSLREIAIHAGQKNTNAVQYHFGSKNGLINAIWQRHAKKIEQQRILLLEKLPAKPGLRELVQVIVLPIAEKMHDEDGGKYYLQIMSQLISYSGENLMALFAGTPDETSKKIMADIAPYIAHLSETERMARTLFVTGVIFHSLADYLRLKNANAAYVEKLQEQDVINNLVSMITAAIYAK